MASLYHLHIASNDDKEPSISHTLISPVTPPLSPIDSQKPLTPFAKPHGIHHTNADTYELDFPSLSRSITLALVLPNHPSTIASVQQRPPTPSETYDLFADISPRALKILSHANPSLFLSSMHFPMQPSKEKDVAEVCVGWLCVVDDVVEDLKTTEEVEILVDALEKIMTDAISGQLLPADCYTEPWIQNAHALSALRVTYLVCSVTIAKNSISHRFRVPLLNSLLDILANFRLERAVAPTDLHGWLKIHATTMGFSTFFILLRSLLDYTEEMEEVEMMVRVAAGLQNDLFGLEKDVRDGNPLNSAIVLAKREGRTVADCVEQIARLHNNLVVEIEEAVKEFRGKRYPALMAGTVGGHARWAGMIKRYAKN